MRLFHYHLVTSKVREVEARYIGKLGFTLVARHGRIDEDTTSFESGHGWEELDELGFKLRLSELERGAGNVVVQPGQWELPRLDHLGFALDEDDFVATLARAELRELRVQEHGGRRTFISTNAGYRLRAPPPPAGAAKLPSRRMRFTGSSAPRPASGSTTSSRGTRS